MKDSQAACALFQPSGDCRQIELLSRDTFTGHLFTEHLKIKPKARFQHVTHVGRVLFSV